MKTVSVLFALFSAVTPLHAVVVLLPTQDRDVYEGSQSPTSSTKDLGVSNSDWAGGGHSQRSVVQFDVTTATTGLTADQVGKATLNLYILPKLEAYPIGRAIGGDIHASIQTVAWSETGSPGLHWSMLLNPGELLDTLTLVPDRDYPYDELGTTIYETEIWVELDITSAVRQWLNGDLPNFGILLWPDEDPSQNSGILFADSSNGLATSPFLKIEPAAEPEPAELAITACSFAGAEVSLTWNSQAGKTYSILESPDLSSWEEVASVTADSASTTHSFTGTEFPERRAFYIVEELPAGE